MFPPIHASVYVLSHVSIVIDAIDYVTCGVILLRKLMNYRHVLFLVFLTSQNQRHLTQQEHPIRLV